MTDVLKLKDETIVAKFKATRSNDDFKLLAERYQNKLYKTAFKILEDAGEAEEIVQETFIRVWHNLEKFRYKTSFAAWIHTIAHNLCVDILRDRQRTKVAQRLSFQPQSSLDNSDLEFIQKRVIKQIPDHVPGPAEQLEFKEQKNAVTQSLQYIPAEQKKVVVLHDIHGFSYRQIATITGASLGTVRSRLHYGRGKLKKILSGKSKQNPRRKNNVHK